jgi:hypothetical protein
VALDFAGSLPYCGGMLKLPQPSGVETPILKPCH